MRDGEHLRGWTTKDSSDLYNVDLWSSRFFTINDEGHVVVRPRRDAGPGIDLKTLVEEMRARGYALPLLLRFVDILYERLKGIAACFDRAFREYGYDGAYRGIYPIKVK